MKKYKVLFNLISLYLLTFISVLFNNPLRSATTILECEGKIPKAIPCLIRANKYESKILRVDICQTDPLPNYKIKADYLENKCIKLLNNKKSFLKNNQNKELIFELSKYGQNSTPSGTYKYLSIIFDNKFKVSGKYKSEDIFWTTGSKGPGNVFQSKKDSKPLTFTEKFNNWRGKQNKDNRYCKNNGGSFSRCELLYNGYKSTGIGLNQEFIETYGNKAKYILYTTELSTPINFNKDLVGSLEIKLINYLEVFGDGNSVKSFSVAPFLFKTIYTKN